MFDMAQIVKSGKAIRLEAVSPLEKRRELRPWKEKGFRVADPNGRQGPEEFRNLVVETGEMELWKKRSKNSIFT